MSTAELIGQAVVWKVVSTLALIAFLAAVAVIAGIVERRGRVASDVDVTDYSDDADVVQHMDSENSSEIGRQTSMRLDGKLPNSIAGARQIATKRPDYVL